jgi:hypothetical protein
MAEQGYPNFCGQPGGRLYSFSVDGSAVTSATSTAGLDGRGQAIATIGDAAGATQTITFLRAFAEAPYVFVQAKTANGAANVSVTASALTLVGVERDDNTAGLADQDFDVFIYSHDTTQFIL